MRKLFGVVAVGLVAVFAYSVGAASQTPRVSILAAVWPGALIALGFGLLIGAAYARTRRARTDWKGYKAAMRRERRRTFGLGWLTGKRVVLLAVVIAVAVAISGGVPK